MPKPKKAQSRGEAAIYTLTWHYKDSPKSRQTSEIGAESEAAALKKASELYPKCKFLSAVYSRPFGAASAPQPEPPRRVPNFDHPIFFEGIDSEVL